MSEYYNPNRMESWKYGKKKFEEFNSVFKTEDTDGFSVQNLEQDINNEVKEWNIEFGLKINPLQPNDIEKNLKELGF